jgi:replicative DNA helicase
MIKENKDMDNQQLSDKFSLDGIEPYMLQVSNLNKPLLTIHADGRITVSEDLKPTETAAEVLKIMQDMWLHDQQVVKIKELKEKIKRLEETGDEIVINYVNSLSAFELWRKAKEAKP